MRTTHLHLFALIILGLTGCGGTNDGIIHSSTQALPALAAAPAAEVTGLATPAFHRLGYQLDPRGTGGIRQTVPDGLRPIDTALLVDDDSELAARLAKRRDSSATAAAAVTMVVHSPAEIRRAYGMPSLADATPEDLGAGQTIYIIGAYNNPNLLSDLRTFNNKFGLPHCKEIKIPVNTEKLPPAPVDECSIGIVYANLYGSLMKADAPAYNRTWAVESALDVQWAHATAPLARIIVIESLNNFVNSFADSLKLANRLGPGVVSMSWVAGELPTYTEKYEAFFRGDGMTYFAAAGDFGAQGNWPATSPSVIAVGGTSLKITANGREETAWSKSGAGYSAYFKAPPYQASLTGPGGTTGKYSTTPGVRARASSDVSFNADPYTGQYVYFTPRGGAGSWYSYGGTSIATPQWAGLAAAVNAHRAKAGNGTLGKFHDRLYNYYGPSIGGYARTFSDISLGANCAASWCQSTNGWDVPTGWGTPNFPQLLLALTR